MNYIDKIQQAKELLLQAEAEILDQKGYCFYEIGYALRSIEEALSLFNEQVI